MLIVINKIREFIYNPSFPYGRWFEDKYISAYIRVSHRYDPVDGQRYECLDLASIDVKEAKFRRKGLFKEFLKQLQQINPFPVLFVENVHNEFLADWFNRQEEWTKTKDEIPCYWYNQPAENRSE